MERHTLYSVAEVERLRATISDLLSRLMLTQPQPAKDESGWLIEWPATDNNPPRWWHPVDGWMVDAGRGCRFARKDDAEAYIKTGCYCVPVIATEHVWIGLRASAAA